jgi:Ala-tRNA(Pro) deacylase
MNKILESYLKKHNISYKENKHKAVFTVEESKKIKLSFPCLHTKSLFLKSSSELGNKKTKYYLICLQADKRLDIKALQKHLKHEKLTFASQQELSSFLNVSPGSVSIFTLINSSSSYVSLILDKDIYNANSVGFHPNINTSTLILSHENFIKFYNSLKQEKEILEL